MWKNIYSKEVFFAYNSLNTDVNLYFKFAQNYWYPENLEIIIAIFVEYKKPVSANGVPTCITYSMLYEWHLFFFTPVDVMHS